MTTDLAAYRELCAGKRPKPLADGISGFRELNSKLAPHAAYAVDCGLRAGRYGFFFDTGLFKTSMELEFGQVLVETFNRPFLLFAPLGVTGQHIREAERLGIEAVPCRFGNPPTHPCIGVANYERAHLFDPNDWVGVGLDEGSILKSFDGKTSRKLIEMFHNIRFRADASATPAPNDYTEIGQHSAFLGVMRREEMLVRWFIHDSMNTKVWRLKRHAVRAFWDWVASWSLCVGKPSDIGFSDEGFELPPLEVRRWILRADRMVDAGTEKDGQGRLFRIPDRSATATHKERRLTKEIRARRVGEIVEAHPEEPICIWVDTDYEAEVVRAAVPQAVEVHGSMHPDAKEERLDSFSEGQTRIILTKPKIAGWGLNWQHCALPIYAGETFSYEAFYQTVRRFWRFGQKRTVRPQIVCSDTELEIASIRIRKGEDHDRMKAEMSAAMARACRAHSVLDAYQPSLRGSLPPWIV